MKANNFIKILLVLIISLLSIVALIGCSDEEENKIPHTEHTWDKGTVKAQGNCIAEGVMEYSCTICGEKMEKSTGLSHSYKDRVCTLCGTSTNPSLILLDSIISADSYTLKGKDISVSLGEDKSYSIDTLEAKVNVDNDGYFVGNGVVKGAKNSSTEFEYSITLKDKSVFVYDGEILIRSYTQEQLLKLIPGNLFELIHNDSEMKSTISKLWQTLLDTENNAINQKLKRLCSYIFNSTESGNTCLYTLNSSFTKSLFNSIKNDSVNEFIDLALDAGTYDSLLNAINSGLDKSFAEIEGEITSLTEELGISKDSLFSELSNMLDMNIDSLLELIKDKKVYEIINLILGLDASLDDYKGIIQSVDEILKSTTLFDFIIEPFLEERLGLDYDTISKLLDSIVKASSFQFITTQSGELISAKEHYEDFSFSEAFGDYTLNVRISGILSISLE